MSKQYKPIDYTDNRPVDEYMRDTHLSKCVSFYEDIDDDSEAYICRPHGDHMTGAHFVTILDEHKEVGRCIRAAARRYAGRNDIEQQEDYIQEAYLRLAQCPPNYSIEFYCEEVRKAIEAAYRKDYRRRKAEKVLTQQR